MREAMERSPFGRARLGASAAALMSGLVAFGPATASSAAPPPAIACATVCYVDAITGSAANGGTGPTDALATIQQGIDRVDALGTVIVAAGTYVEDVTVSKTVNLVGAGESSIVSGPAGGGFATIFVSAPNVVIDAFTITREGNAAATWGNNLNTAGIGINGASGVEISNSLLTGNRTAINLVNASGAKIHNNVINDNRTGLIFWDDNSNVSVEQNRITNNWTMGLLFIPDLPNPSNANSVYTNNNISGNWYGQVVDRQGTGETKNFSGNYLGTTNPVITTSDSTEPGYGALIPAQFTGGTAVRPVGQPDIAGPTSGNVDFTPMLDSGVDTSPAIYGFQGSKAAVTVTSISPQSGAVELVQEGIDLVDAAGTVHISAGTYAESAPVTIDKALTLAGPNAGISPNNASARIIPSSLRLPEATITVTGANEAIVIGAPNVTVDGLRFTDAATPGTSNVTFIGAGQDFGGGAPHVKVTNNVFDGITRVAVSFRGSTSMDGGTVEDNRVNSPTRAWGCGSSPTIVPPNCARPLFNLWQTDHLSFQRNVVISNPATVGDGFRVLSVDFPSGPSLQNDAPNTNVTIAHNAIRYSCTFACFMLAGPTTNVEIFNNDVLLAEGNIVVFDTTWTGGRVNMTRNTLLDSGSFAIAVANPAADLTKITVNRNAIGGLGITNAASGSFNAECNWWGEATGPVTIQNSGLVDAVPPLPNANVDGMCDVPKSVVGVPGDGQVSVSWLAPASNNGAPITGYTATSAPDGKTCTTSGALTCVVPGLTNGTPYTFTVAAQNSVNTGPSSLPSAPVTPFHVSSPTVIPDYNPVGPKRVFDTRPGQSPDAIRSVLKQKIGGPNVLEVTFIGLGGLVPTTGAGAVSINVTVDNPEGAGFITVYPCGERRLVSSVNYAAGGTVANGVISPLSSTGTICFFSSQSTDLIVDINGWFVQGKAFTGVDPKRVFDTRPGQSLEALRTVAKDKVGGSKTLMVKMIGLTGAVPATGVGAVSLNVTVDNPTTAGFVTVYPCTDTREFVSSVNFVAGQTVANAVITTVSAEGNVCFFSTSDVDLIVDVNGWLKDVSGYHSLPSPQRLFDSRPGESPNSLISVDKSQIGGAKVLQVRVTGVGGVPATGASTVSLNVTATNPAGPGFITVYPCGVRELVSSVNYTTGQTVPNAVIAPLSNAGEICIFSSQSTDVVVDVNGWFAS